MAYPPILIVDEHDNPIGKASMTEAQAKGLYHRIVRIMVLNGKGELLLQKRSHKMINSPGLWDHSAAGHVDFDETDDIAAKREAAEEVGLEDTPLEFLGRWQSNHTKGERIMNRFNIAYLVKLDDPKPQANTEEVDELRWYSMDEVKRLIAEHPDDVTDGLKHVIKEYF